MNTIYRTELINQVSIMAGVSFARSKEIIISYVDFVKEAVSLGKPINFLKVCNIRAQKTNLDFTDSRRYTPLQRQINQVANQFYLPVSEVESVLQGLNGVLSYEVSKGNPVVITSLFKIESNPAEDKIYFFKSGSLPNGVRVFRDPRFLESIERNK